MPKPFVVEASKTYEFYRQSFYSLIKMAFLQLTLIFCLIGVIFFQLFNQPDEEFFLTTTTGEVIHIQAQ